MGQLKSSRFNLGVASLVVGIALTSLARPTDGFVRGMLLGAGITLILLSAYVMGRSARDGGGWLPRRDGDPVSGRGPARDEP